MSDNEWIIVTCTILIDAIFSRFLVCRFSLAEIIVVISNPINSIHPNGLCLSIVLQKLNIQQLYVVEDVVSSSLWLLFATS